MTSKKNLTREKFLGNSKKPLSAAEKKDIELVVKRILAEYGDTIKKLGQND